MLIKLAPAVGLHQLPSLPPVPSSLHLACAASHITSDIAAGHITSHITLQMPKNNNNQSTPHSLIHYQKKDSFHVEDKLEKHAWAQNYVIILVFYLGSTLVVGLLVPYSSPQLLGSTSDASSSPFVIAINRAGITVLPDMINVVILLSAIYTASSKLYGGSRVLFGLLKDGMAPRIFSKCNASGLPMWSLLATCSAAALSFMCLNSKAGVAFQWFQNLSAMTGILTWWSVLVSYIFFYQGLKVQGLSRDKLHYKDPFQPSSSWLALTMLTLIMLMSGFETFLKGGWSISDFLANYLTLPIFLGFYLFWKISKRSKIVSPKHVDFVTGTRELNEMDAQEREKEIIPTTKWGKFIDKLL